MDQLLSNLEMLIPEAMGMARLRYGVLREVLYNQPVGRRQIALRMHCSERAARSEIAVLRDMGAVAITPAGIELTDHGMDMLSMADEVMPILEGLSSLAQRLQQYLGLEQVVLVPGDSYLDPYTKRELGRAAARFFKEALSSSVTMAVTGGSTLAEMGKAIPAGLPGSGVVVLPARGGLGEKIELQANAIAAHIAEAVGGSYRMLHIPDNLEQKTIDSLMFNSQVAEVVAQLKQCDIVVHGIGSAMEMANLRGLDQETLKTLENQRAVGEAFRYYFNASGEIVYNVAGIGLELSDLASIPLVVAVAGGSNKAQAIEAVLKNRRRGVLISDEGAARAILERGKE